MVLVNSIRTVATTDKGRFWLAELGVSMIWAQRLKRKKPEKARKSQKSQDTYHFLQPDKKMGSERTDPIIQTANTEHVT